MQSTRVTLLLLVLVSVLATAAFAHDRDHGHGHHHDNNKCIECKNCRQNENWCYNKCKKGCNSVSTAGVNIEACKGYGNNAGAKSAQTSCELTLKYCRGGQRSFGAPQRTMVSLQQCGNAAYGVCQAKAMDPRQSPCGGSFNGVANCNKDEFMRFYTGSVDAECNAATAAFDKQ